MSTGWSVPNPISDTVITCVLLYLFTIKPSGKFPTVGPSSCNFFRRADIGPATPPAPRLRLRPLLGEVPRRARLSPLLRAALLGDYAVR